MTWEQIARELLKILEGILTDNQLDFRPTGQTTIRERLTTLQQEMKTAQ